MGVSLRQMAPLMNLSVASLFGYRAGKLKISNKAWSKLERCEKPFQKVDKSPESAGISGEPNLVSIPKMVTDSSVLREDVAEYKVRRRVDPPFKECPRIVMMERSIDVMSAQLELMREQLKQLKENR
jgi:hypothetical protein